MAAFDEISLKKILLTGFEPFLKHESNPSQILVSKLIRKNVETVILPVSFSEAPKLIRQKLSANQFDFVLSLGLAADRKAICFERVAINWQESKSADNDGYLPALGPLNDSLRAAVISDLPLHGWKQKIDALNIPCEISFSAGAYVCNALYFELLKNQPIGPRALFMHVPLFAQISEESQTQGLHLVLDLIQDL